MSAFYACRFFVLPDDTNDWSKGFSLARTTEQRVLLRREDALYPYSTYGINYSIVSLPPAPNFPENIGEVSIVLGMIVLPGIASVARTAARRAQWLRGIGYDSFLNIDALTSSASCLPSFLRTKQKQ